MTRGQYRKFIDAGGYSSKSYWSADGWDWKTAKKRMHPDSWDAHQKLIIYSKTYEFTQTDDYPVIGVNYYEAEAFCNWAGGHLPTEAQWERAACWDSASQHANIYPWGDAPDDTKCNNRSSSFDGPSPVDSYPAGASPCGCIDMIGNVDQWCKDWYLDDYYAQGTDRRLARPRGPGERREAHRARGAGFLQLETYSRWDSLHSGQQRARFRSG